jgi:hypothetical protein
MDEIRFNRPATSYDHPVVQAHLEKAAEILPVVTIAIPAILDDAGRPAQWSRPEGQRTDLHLKSRSLVPAIMKSVISKNIPLWVNDCSSQSKQR